MCCFIRLLPEHSQHSGEFAVHGKLNCNPINTMLHVPPTSCAMLTHAVHINHNIASNSITQRSSQEMLQHRQGCMYRETWKYDDVSRSIAQHVHQFNHANLSDKTRGTSRCHFDFSPARRRPSDARNQQLRTKTCPMCQLTSERCSLAMIRCSKDHIFYINYTSSHLRKVWPQGKAVSQGSWHQAVVFAIVKPSEVQCACNRIFCHPAIVALV